MNVFFKSLVDTNIWTYHDQGVVGMLLNGALQTVAIIHTCREESEETEINKSNTHHSYQYWIIMKPLACLQKKALYRMQHA